MIMLGQSNQQFMLHSEKLRSGIVIGIASRKQLVVLSAPLHEQLPHPSFVGTINQQLFNCVIITS